MRYGKLIRLLLVLLPLGGSVRAQDERPGFRVISVNDGLSQNSVNSILQDRHGYMWLGTGDGLNRYDGNSIRIYKIGDSALAAANSNTIRGKMCEDKHGNIWFSTETGLYCLNRLQQTIVHALVWNTSAALKAYIWYQLECMDDDGNLYLLSPTKGVLQYSPTLAAQQSMPVTNALRHYRVAIADDTTDTNLFSALDRSGKIWFRANKKGVCVFDPKTKQITTKLEGRTVRGVSFGREKTYICVPGYICVADSEMHVTDSIALPPQVKALTRPVYEDGYGHIWMLTCNNDVYRYNPATRKVIPLSDARMAAHCRNPVTIYNDRNNNMWIGTDSRGVCRIDTKPGKFSGFPMDNNDELTGGKYFVKCVYEDRVGRVWFGTFENGLLCLNKETGALDAYNVAGKVVGDIAEDREQHIWVGGSKGIFVLRNGRWQKMKLGAAEPHDPMDLFVSAFLPLGPGRMLAATTRGVLLITIQGNSNKVTTLGMKGGRIMDMEQLRDGTIWITKRHEGAFRIAIRNDSIGLLEQVFPNSNTSCILADKQDAQVLWIGADKGLVRYDTRSKKMRTYSDADGLGNSHVYAVMEDVKHKLWMSTNGGIYCFDKSAERFKNYTVKDGLQSNEFNTDCCYESRSGTMYFGGINGFNWFDPMAPSQDTVAPLLDVASVSIDDTLAGKQYWSEDSVVMLPYGKKTIRFSFAVLDYTMPEANTIMYTLGDEDDKWYKANERTVQYTSLSPGDYTLRIKAVNSAGVESREQQLKFTMLPPFWRRPWFALSSAAAAIAIIVLLTRSIAHRKLRARLAELERIKEIDKERLRISREMHDDIGAGLTQITLMTEMAKNKPIAADSKELQDIAITSRRLVSNMNEIIWSLNAEGRTLEHLFAYLRENLNKMLEYSGMEYTITFPEPVPDIALSNEQRRNLLLIVKEAANNAVKYSKAANIDITATLTEEALSFTVKDDGMGFNVSQQRAGNGMNNLRKRTTDLDGLLEITSAAQQGTKVTVSIPLKSHFKTGK